MITIEKDGFIFSADVGKTKEYYSAHSVCNCSCCRNLYAQIKALFPKLDAFLSEFGIDICRPDEAASVENEDHIDYLFVGYTVTGVMETDGIYETDIDNLHITVSRGDDPFEWFPHEQTEPRFFISISGISLPWVLDEPFPKVEPFSKKENFGDKIKRFFKRQ